MKIEIFDLVKYKSSDAKLKEILISIEFFESIIKIKSAFLV